MRLGVTEWSGQRVYVDANVFIYLLHGSMPQSPWAANVMEAAQSGRLHVCAGQAVVSEVIVGPYRTGDQVLIQHVRDFFEESPLISIVDHDMRCFYDAAILRAMGSPFADALHLATAARHGCTHLITNDARMSAGLGIDVVPLAAFS